MSECKRCSELTERVSALENELAEAMKWFYHEENKAIGLNKENVRLRQVLSVVSASAVRSSPGYYSIAEPAILDVREALQSRQINSQDSAGVYPSQGPEGHGGRQSPEREMPTVIRGDSLSRPAEVTQQVYRYVLNGTEYISETPTLDWSDIITRDGHDATYQLFQEGGESDKLLTVRDRNIKIDGQKFYTVPPCTFAGKQSEHDTRSVVDWEKLASRFLAWPLPQSVCADPCATMRDYPHLRSGTNLLTADEAVRMLKYVLEWDALDPSNYSKPVQKAYAKFQAAMAERKQSEPESSDE